MSLFKHWLSEKAAVLQEIFSTERVRGFRPINGRWEPPLDMPSHHHEYRFSISSEGDKLCFGHPCYYLSIVRDSDNGITISFGHQETNYGDRWGSGAMGQEVMTSVLHGLDEYIQKYKPDHLTWGSTSKTRAGARNPEARSKIYAYWAARELFPHAYVPLSDSFWISREKYVAHYVPNGYPPPPPERISGNKIKAMNMFIKGIEDSREQIAQKTARQNRRTQRNELEQAIANPQCNPNNIRVGDLVMHRQSGNEYRVRRIVDRPAYGEEGCNLFASLATPTGERSVEEIKVSELVRAGPGTRNLNQQRQDALLRSQNPYNFHVGSEVMLGRDNIRYRISGIDMDMSNRRAQAWIIPINREGMRTLQRRVPLSALQPAGTEFASNPSRFDAAG